MKICMDQLAMFLTEYDKIPYKVCKTLSTSSCIGIFVVFGSPLVLLN